MSKSFLDVGLSLLITKWSQLVAHRSLLWLDLPRALGVTRLA